MENPGDDLVICTRTNPARPTDTNTLSSAHTGPIPSPATSSSSTPAARCGTPSRTTDRQGPTAAYRHANRSRGRHGWHRQSTDSYGHAHSHHLGHGLFDLATG